MRYRFWILIAVALFTIGMSAGIVVSTSMTTGVTGFLSEEIAVLERLSAMFGPFQITTAVFILFKNVFVLLLSFILSPVLCLLPILSLTLNGTLLSFVSVILTQQKSLGFVLAGILPHGIIEIPALIIGEAAALSFGVMVIRTLVSRDSRKLLMPNLKQNLKYLGLAMAMLVPAAVIETFVTPLLIR